MERGCIFEFENIRVIDVDHSKNARLLRVTLVRMIQLTHVLPTSRRRLEEQTAIKDDYRINS